MVQVAEILPSKHEALSSKTSTVKKKKEILNSDGIWLLA
jgi:hypothetical protein